MMILGKFINGFVASLVMSAISVFSFTAHAVEFKGLTTLHQGGDSDRVIDIVYLPVGYPIQEDGIPTHPPELIAEWSSEFRTVSPFAEYSSYYNIHYADIVSTLDEKAVIKANIETYFPSYNDRQDILVFLNHEVGTANGSHETRVINIYMEDYPGRIIIHELGHVIGDLADEYVDAEKCPGGVYVGGEPNKFNVTTNNDLETIKWKNWLIENGGILRAPVEGGYYCSNGIWRPSYSSVMNSDDTSLFDPVGREAMVRGFNETVDISISQTPDVDLKNLSYGQSSVRLSVEIDNNIMPNGATPDIQWYVSYNWPIDPPEPITGATGTYIDFDLTKVPAGKISYVWMSVFDPDIADYVRHAPYTQTGYPINSYPEQLVAMGDGMVALWHVSNDLPEPVIDWISDGGKLGDYGSVVGENFCFYECNSYYPSETTVYVNGVPTVPYYVSKNVIFFNIPGGASTGPVTVTTLGGTTISAADLIVDETSPNIIQPYPDNHDGIKEGEDTNLKGYNLCLSQCNATNNITETRVIVNGIDADIKYLTSTAIYFTIAQGTPSGAHSTQVVTPGGTIDVSPFNVISNISINAPRVTSFDMTGSVGDYLGIYGENFCFEQCGSNYPTEVTVYINDHVITPFYAASTVIIYRLPEGATDGQITVTNAYGSFTTNEEFRVAPPPPEIIPGSNPTNLNAIRIGEDSHIDATNLCFLQCYEYTNITETRVIVNGVDADIKNLTPNAVYFTIAEGTPLGQLGTKIVAPGGSVDAPAFNVVP